MTEPRTDESRGVDFALATLLALVLVAGCRCSSGNGGTGDGTPDTDADIDADADGDSDADTDADTDPDSCPGEDVDVPLDAGLDWQPIPPGMDCGPGCRQLTSAGGAEEYDIWGDWMIASEGTGQSSPMITLVDVAQLKTAILDLGFQTIPFFTHHPAVFENSYRYVIRDSPDNAYYYVLGASNDKRYRLLEPCVGALYEFDASGKWLAYVYEESLPGAQDLYVLNRETTERKQVTTFGGVGEITLSGDWVTFTRLGANVEIYAYNVVTEQLSNISNHPADQFNSRNDGPRVVWSDLRNNPDGAYGSNYAEADIYFYDIETLELRQITSGNGIQLYPDINGDWIVWQDWRECSDPNYPYQLCEYVWGFNLVTEEERKLSNIRGEHARVWGDHVYFKSRYQEEPIKGAVFVQEIDPEPLPDGGQ